MIGVDELAAPLAHQAIRPRCGIRMYAATNAIRRFVDVARNASVLQS
jgi:hypothetical protein